MLLSLLLCRCSICSSGCSNIVAVGASIVNDPTTRVIEWSLVDVVVSSEGQWLTQGVCDVRYRTRQWPFFLNDISAFSFRAFSPYTNIRTCTVLPA